MPKREAVLDGLAWAGLTEKARVARISNMLIRELSGPTRNHTQARIRNAVRATAPPYGRGKVICEAVEEEYKRQRPIYWERYDRQHQWKEYQTDEAELSTRINRAYAFRFGRPMYEPHRNWKGDWSDWDARREWEEQENARDKGDNCIALIHQGDHVVCLVTSLNDVHVIHIATIGPDNQVVRTYLRTDHRRDPKTLVEAAVSLGGPKVRAAISAGKKVVTDWVGRRSFIHHEGQDHVHPHVEELPWLAATLKVAANPWGGEAHVPTDIIVLGESVEPATG